MILETDIKNQSSIQDMSKKYKSNINQNQINLLKCMIQIQILIYLRKIIS